MSRKMKHGHSLAGRRSPTWNSWRAMRKRCRQRSHDSFALYGARGIMVCDRWDDFSAFLSDMGVRPAGTSIDRIDPTKGYEPSNCRWVPVAHNSRYKTTTRLSDTLVNEIRGRFEHGEGQASIARRVSLSPATIYDVVRHRIWNTEATCQAC